MVSGLTIMMERGLRVVLDPISMKRRYLSLAPPFASFESYLLVCDNALAMEF
jgi:hypothetical protein